MDLTALFEYLLIIFCVLVLLLIRFFIGREFCSAAEEKGYDSAKYLYWILLTGIPGMLLVIALPDRGAAPAAVPVPQSAPAARKAGSVQVTEPERITPKKNSSGSARSASSRSTLEAQDNDALPRL